MAGERNDGSFLMIMDQIAGHGLGVARFTLLLLCNYQGLFCGSFKIM